MARLATIVPLALGLAAVCGAAPAQPAAPPPSSPAHTQVDPRLFDLMDLSRPDLATVRRYVERGEHAAAMRAYRELVAARLSALPRREKFGYWLFPGADADRLLEGELTLDKYGDPTTRYTARIGKPGEIDFFTQASSGYDLSIRDISSMHWATKLAEAYQKTGDARYLIGWIATWDDFARNWEIQYAAVKKNPKYWGQRPDGRRNLIGIDWLNAQLYLHWRQEALLHGLIAVFQTAKKSGHVERIDAAALARILARVATAENARSRQWFARAETLVPNQIRSLANTTFAWGGYFGEFRDASWWRSEAVPSFTLTHQPDGTDREHSLNYFRNDFKEVIEVLHTMPPADADPRLLADLEAKSAYRDRFIPSIARPDGISPSVGKNNIWRNYGQTQPLRPPSTAFTSILFPYAGFAVQRDGWQADSRYLFMKISRPSIGHWRAQDGGLQLSAFGRNLLVSAIGETYDSRDVERGWAGYWLSAAGQNTVLVDGLSAQRRTGDFDKLDSTLWHSSAAFDFMETEISGPYGGWNFRRDGASAGARMLRGEFKPDNDVNDVTHRRQVHFLREAGCWIVTDRIDARSPHDFTQTWCVGPEFSEAEVATDVTKQVIQTKQPQAPNLSIHQFGTHKLTYEKFFGVHEDDRVLGWVGVFADRARWRYTPAVNVHANWRGEGRQLLITLLVPHRGLASPVKMITPVSDGAVQGFDAELADGMRLAYRAAPEPATLVLGGMRAEAASLLMVRDAKGNTSGVVLGAQKVNGEIPAHRDYEFGPGLETIVPLTAPAGFGWKESAAGLVPDYSAGGGR